MVINSRTQRALFWVVVLCLSFSPSLSYSQTTSINPTARVRIGVAVPLSGPAAWLGNSTQQGIELYLSEHPDFAQHTEFLYQDVGTNTGTSGVSAVHVLVEANKVAALIIENSNVTNAVAPFLDQVRIPSIAITGSDAARGKAYMVKLWFPLANEAKAIKEFLSVHQISPIVIVTTEHDSMLDRTRALLDILEEKTVVQESLSITTADDVPNVAAKVSKLAPRAVVLNLMPGQCGLFARKLREFGYSGQLLSNVTASEESERKLAAGSLHGTKYPSFFSNPSFAAAFRAKYGIEPFGAAPNGYDAAKLFDRALKNSEPAHLSEKILSELKVKDFSGALGQYSFGFDAANNFDLPVSLMTVE